MMINYLVNHIFPKFILQDKNGYALAKAIKAGLDYFLERAEDGLKITQDVDSMPEWRLDEMAWETDCMYDYSAETEIKREWIRNAIPLYSNWGTPQSVKEFLKGYFGEIELQEWWQYGGEEYHFRLTLGGEWNDQNEAWARREIERAKNVRSIMDQLAAGTTFIIKASAKADWFKFPYLQTGTYNAGTWPYHVKEGYIERGDIEIIAPGEGYNFPYPVAGTRPEIAKIGIIDAGGAVVTAPGDAYVFTWPQTGNLEAGTHPIETHMGATGAGTAEVAMEEATYSVEPNVCGDEGLF